ncbi:MAG: hypothetical protein ABIJ19_01070, partial [Patescibacteria group bacterium]
MVFSGESVEQGGALIVRLDGVWHVPLEARFGTKQVYFFRRWLNYFAIIGIDSKEKIGKKSFFIRLASEKELTHELEILPRSVNKTKLTIPQK